MSAHAEPSALVASNAARAPAATQVAEHARTLSWTDRLTLAAIGLVVVIVTLPVLRGFALRANELDALRTVRALAAQPAVPASVAAPGDLAALAANDRALQRRLEDLEILPDGRLRRHGYLFDVVHAGAGGSMLRAWPWEHGQTGRGAFVWTAQTGLLGHANGEGLFSGPDQAPVQVPGPGWVRMKR